MRGGGFVIGGLVIGAAALMPGCFGGLDFVESLSGASCRVIEVASATAAWTNATVRRCASDDECVLAHDSCCACAGGEFIPVSVVYADTVERERQARCAGERICVAANTCDAEAARCVDGMCVLCGGE